MSTIKSFRETSIPTNFATMFNSEAYTTIASPEQEIGTEKLKQGYIITNEVAALDQRRDDCNSFSTFFAACADVMAQDALKCKDAKTALTFVDPTSTGTPLAACICEYIDEGEGNYNFHFTFNPEELKGIPEENIFSFTTLESAKQSIKPWSVIFDHRLATLHFRTIQNTELINQITIFIIKCIYGWLDENAVEGEVVSVKFDDAPTHEGSPENPLSAEDYKNSFIDYAIASVEVVKNKKIMSIVFGEEMKATAKGNADIDSV